MATQAQIEANRRNAQRSTGPTTARGKAVSSRNARKHGASVAGLLPDEDPAEFEGFVERLRKDPTLSRATNKQIRKYADAVWHVRRANRALFPLFDYAVEHPIEGIRRIAAVHKAVSKYRRIERVLLPQICPAIQFKRLKSQIRRIEPNPPPNLPPAVPHTNT